MTASHELLEMLVDPDINMAVLVHPTPNESKLYAYEVCDACQDDSFGYDIDGVTVGDFVYPAYFESFHAAEHDVRPPGQAAKAVPELCPAAHQHVRHEQRDRLASGDGGDADPPLAADDPRPHLQPTKRRRMPRSHSVHSTAFT